MTFQHGGHGCLGIGGILGAFGIHLPEHHLPNLPHPGSFPHPVRDAIHNAIGGGSGGFSGGHPDPGESAWMMGGQPLNLIFGDPVAAEAHHFSLAAIPVGGGVTMSIVALVMVIALTLIMASMMVKAVAVRMAARAPDVIKVPNERVIAMARC
jgi:hypothetical protein